MTDKIQIGDKVNVFFENIDAEFDLEVLHIPVATGDSWHLRTENGTLIYVNMFSKMIKIN